MKVEIHNLNVISNAEIDLKPLTVLIGPNNAGKTWLAYVLAGILGVQGWKEYAHAYAHEQLPKAYPPLDLAIEQVLTKGNATINLHDFAEKYGETYFQNVADYAQHWMNGYMGTQFTHFDTLKVALSLSEVKAEFLGRVEKYAMQRDIAGDLLSIRKKQDDKIIYFYTSTDDDESLTDKLLPEEIRERLVGTITQVLHQSLYPRVRVFPTTRTMLVAFPFYSNTRNTGTLPINDHIREVFKTIDEGIQKLQDLTGMNISTLSEKNARAATGAESNFLSMMSYVFRSGSKQRAAREKAAKNNSSIQKYRLLAEVLEKKILAGNINFSTPEPDPRRDILFQPTENVMLDMPIASSMVKELVPLVLYLRYLAEPGELLIIDEPEMNLHPIAQIQIIEFLALLANAGLKVLITTHSTYAVDHLSNLIEAYKQEKQDDIASLFLLKRKEAFISQTEVSIYSVEDGKVNTILDPEGNIDWRTFSDATKLVERIHFELLGD